MYLGSKGWNMLEAFGMSNKHEHKIRKEMSKCCCSCVGEDLPTYLPTYLPTLVGTCKKGKNMTQRCELERGEEDLKVVVVVVVE